MDCPRAVRRTVLPSRHAGEALDCFMTCKYWFSRAGGTLSATSQCGYTLSNPAFVECNCSELVDSADTIHACVSTEVPMSLLWGLLLLAHRLSWLAPRLGGGCMGCLRHNQILGLLPLDAQSTRTFAKKMYMLRGVLVCIQGPCTQSFPFCGATWSRCPQHPPTPCVFATYTA